MADLIKRRLDEEADINAKDGDLTLLIKAATEGYLKTAKLLIEQGADVNARTNKGSSALMAASMAGYTKIVELLINAGANAKAKNNMDYTTEIYTNEKGYTNINRLLNKVVDRSEVEM